jgi:YesN/AraC family two-component response regulator
LKYSSATDIKSKQQHMDQLLPAIQLIEAQCSQSITLAEVAEQLKVTPQYACHLFQQSLGMRPFEYITKVRLRKAKEMLVQQPHRQVHEIGAQVGYEHPSYFIKVFKQHEGVTPSVFRSIHRE